MRITDLIHSFMNNFRQRPAAPTPGDLWFVRYGFLVTEAATWFVGQAVWQQMGRI